jgi:hypothetical protein
MHVPSPGLWTPSHPGRQGGHVQAPQQLPEMVEIWGLEKTCHGVNCCAMSWESRDVFWLGDFKGF